MSFKKTIVPTDDFVTHKFKTIAGERETGTPLKRMILTDKSKYDGAALREIRKTHR
jgi:hypothetical protein